MYQEPQSYVRDTYELVKENNRLLKKMRRAQWWGGFFKVLWWFVILGLPLFFYYYYVLPYQQQLLDTYQQLQQGAEQVRGLNFDATVPQWLKDILRMFGLMGTSTPQ